MKTETYPKTEKLKHKKDIDLLFEKGKWRKHGNLRIIFLKKEDLSAQKIGVSVSKRYFKKAVHRNRVKRLLREAYRLNKEEYLNAFGKNSIAMLFWTSPNLPEKLKLVEEEFLNLCQSVKS